MATIDTHTFVTNFNADGQAPNVELMTDERGHLYPISHLFDGHTLGNAMKVSASSEAGRVVNIEAGYVQIPFDDYAYLGWLETNMTLNIEPNQSSNPRYSAIVAYIKRDVMHDNSVTNNPKTLLITEVEGTPSSSPVEVGENRILEDVEGNPYIVLAQIYVPAGATSIAPNSISDKRTGITLREGVKLPYGSYATGLRQATGSSFTNPIQIAVIDANGTVPPALPDADLLVCRISQ